MSKYLKHFPGLILLCVVFSPPLKFLPSLLSAVRAEDFLLVPVAAFVLLSVRWRPPSNARRDALPALFAYLGLCGMVGMNIGVLAFRQNLIVKDLILLPQIIKYILIYVVMKRLLASAEIADTTKRYILVSAFLAALVGVAQYWNLFDVNAWFSPLYISKQELLTIMLDPTMNWRVRGTMVNANIYGTALVWHASFALAHCTNATKRKTQVVSLLATLLLAFAIALTQSRSSLGLLVIIWTLTLFTGTRYGAKRNLLSFRAVVLVILMVLALWGLADWIETSQRGFGSRLALSTSSAQTSYKARIRDLVQPIFQTFDAPLSIPFGRGPSKTALRTDSHNGYGWILLRFGLVGLVLYLGILMTILRRAVGSLNAEAHQENRAIVLFVFLTVCVWILVEFTNANFKLPSLIALNMFSAGWLSAELSKGLHPVSQKRPSSSLTKPTNPFHSNKLSC